MRQESCKLPRRVGALSVSRRAGRRLWRRRWAITDRQRFSRNTGNRCRFSESCHRDFAEVPRIFNAAESAFGGQAIRKSIHIGFANAFCDSQRAQQGPCAFTYRGNIMVNRKRASFDPTQFLAKIGEGKSVSRYHKKQVIFSQGEIAEAIFYIQQGKVKLTVVSEQGKEAVVAILGVGHFFGEGCLNGHPLRVSTTTAIDDCVITRIEKATMIATIHKEPKFSELFMSYILARNSRIEEDLIDQLFNSSEKRLARLLLLLANFGKEGKPEPIMGKISQETLAEMIGTTRARVSFFMNKFRKLGFIEYNGNLEVHSSLLNMVLHEKPEIKTRDEAIDRK